MDSTQVSASSPTGGYTPYTQAYEDTPQPVPKKIDQPVTYSNPTSSSPVSLGPIKKIFRMLLILLVILLFAVGFMKYMYPFFFSPQEEDVTLTYWGVEAPSAAQKSLVDAFEKQYPHITIAYTQQDKKDYAKKLTERIKNGSGPDLYSFHNTWLPMLSNYLIPFPTDVITPDTFKNTYYPVIRRDLVKNGAIYGIPLGIDTLALYINPDIFSAGGQQAPQTWEDFKKVAEALVVKDTASRIRTAGAAMGNVSNITHADDILAMLFVQNGTDLKNIESTSDQAADALTFYTNFAKSDTSVWDDTLDPSLLAFAKGNLAMYFGYARDVADIKAANPGASFAIFPVPALPNRGITIASYWAEGVSVKTKHQKEALLFMHYLAQKKTAEDYLSESLRTQPIGVPPARVDLAESAKENQNLKPFIEQAPDAVSSYFISNLEDSDGINAQMNGYLENAVRTIQGNGSVDYAIKPLSDGVRQVLTYYGL